MKKMAVANLSSAYSVRILTEEDIPIIYQFCLTNPQYYHYHSIDLSRELIYEDLTLLPPGKSGDDKYFVGFFDKTRRLIAVLDLIDGYPTEDTAYFGFFMVAAQESGKGIGSNIIDELCENLLARGFHSVRLSYGKSNPQSSHFWQKNHFTAVREANHSKYGRMIVAERLLIV